MLSELNRKKTYNAGYTDTMQESALADSNIGTEDGKHEHIYYREACVMCVDPDLRVVDES